MERAYLIEIHVCHVLNRNTRYSFGLSMFDFNVKSGVPLNVVLDSEPLTFIEAWSHIETELNC